MRKRKKSPIEYRLSIFPSHTELPMKHAMVFRLETVKEFSNFSYAIAVEERMTDDAIIWKVHGLRAPEISLPAVGPATYEKKYENLRRVHSFTIVKLDGVENTFSLDIVDEKVSVIKTPRHRFLEILTPAHATATAPET
jgi:hypothetical protein